MQCGEAGVVLCIFLEFDVQRRSCLRLNIRCGSHIATLDRCDLRFVGAHSNFSEIFSSVTVRIIPGGTSLAPPHQVNKLPLKGTPLHSTHISKAQPK